MKVAWVSPLPPNPSGIADYSADLLPVVSELAETIAFTTETAWNSDAYSGKVLSIDLLPRYLRQGFVPIYHQGNNRHHREVYDLACSYPGVLVLHDVVLHHFLLDRAQSLRQWSDYKAALVEQYPEAAQDLFRLRKNRVGSELDKFLWPLSGPLIRRSQKTIVHSHYAADLVRAEVPEANVDIVLHHQGVPPGNVILNPAEVRSQLGLDKDFLVGSFGYVTGPKQGNVLLGAIHALRAEGIPVSAVFVGSDESRGMMRSLASDLEIDPFVRFTGYLDRQAFYSYMNAVDVVVALRYPSAGETSGTLSRALSMGKCLVVGDYATLAELPSEVCLHVPVFGDIAPEVADRLRYLFTDESLRRQLGNAARRYAREHLSVDHSARAYLLAAAKL